MSSKNIRDAQKEELKRIRPINRAKVIQYTVVFALFLSLVSVIPYTQETNIDRAARALVTTNKLENLSFTILEGSQWLMTHGTQIELNLFEYFSQKFLTFVQNRPSNSFYVSFLISAVEGLVRVTFVLLASMRLWLLLLAFGIYRSWNNFKPYVGPDLLGETGNDKLFFSGIRAGLSDVNADGTPNLLVTNLSCLKQASNQDPNLAKLISILKEFGVQNQTTIELCRIISAYPHVPFFAPQVDDQSIIEGTVRTLPLMLKDYNDLQDTSQESPASHLVRVMKPFVESINQIHPVEIAVIILSIQCGKIMGYLKEGNKWVQRSSNLNLNARSVLHSVASFKTEFNYVERDRIRQALVYGSRFTILGPIRLPIELPYEARALRQVSELLLSHPSEVERRADDIELYGLSFVLMQKFELKFFELLKRRDPFLIDNATVTESGIIALSVQSLVNIFDSFVSASERENLYKLVQSVSENNISAVLTRSDYEDIESHGPLPQSQKIFSPFSAEVSRNILSEMKLEKTVVEKWGYYRNILNTFGWLAKQVGSTAVPESSICFIVFKDTKTDVKRTGKIGYVPCRATALELKLGRQWRLYFASSESAMVTDNSAQYEKFLSGYDPTEADVAPDLNSTPGEF